MSWLFLPGGLLMPSTFPADKVDRSIEGFRDDFDIQVRGRVESHLTNFIRDYVDPLNIDHSAIERTPGMDYNVRFYMRKIDLALAVMQTVLDIDYRKFKPTAERKAEDGKTLLYADGVKYHGVLNSIWGTVTRLGSPGGSWSNWDKAPARSNFRSPSGSGYVPRTFGQIEGSHIRYEDDEPAWWNGDRDDMGVPDYGHDFDQQDLADLLDEADEHDIPVSEWETYFSPDEFRALSEAGHVAKRERTEKIEARRLRRVEKRANRRYRRGRGKHNARL